LPLLPAAATAYQGETSEVVFFCVAGKLQVSIGARPVSVLGSGNCFGDWGVRHPKQLHLVHLPYLLPPVVLAAL
jgi:hypothetical protein